MEKRSAGVVSDTSLVFSLFEQQSRTGTWVLESSKGLVHFSAGALTMHGLAPDLNPIGLDEWLACYSDAAQARVQAMLAELQSCSESTAAELEIARPGHPSLYVHLLARRHPEDPEALIGIFFERDCCQAYEASEQARLQESLKNNKYWPDVMDHLKVGMWDWNIRNNHVERTGYWNTLLGIAPGQDTEIQHWEDRIDPEDREKCAALVKDHFEGRTTFFENEYRIRNSPDSFRWIADRGKITEWDEHGEPARMSGIILDITEQKRLQSRLVDRETQFQAVFNSMFQFVGLLEADGSVLECNQAVYEMTGLPYGHMRGVVLWEGTWWKDDHARRIVREAIGKAGAGEFVRLEVEIVDREGVQHRVDFSVKPVFGTNDEIRWLVTEGRHLNPAEESLLPVETPADDDSLPESPRLDDDSSGTVLLVDMNCAILSATQGFSDLIGYTEEELRQMNFREITHPDDLGLDQGYVNGMLTGDCNFYSLEKRLINKNGEVVPVDMEVTVMRRSNGSPLRMLKQIRDLRPAWHEQTLRRI